MIIGDPDSTGVSLSSIYYYRLQIYDRSGNLVFDEDDYIPTTAPQGLDVSTIKWDGYINGQVGGSDVYGYLATIKSCYSGIDLGDVCDLGNDYRTGNSETTYVVGDISLLYNFDWCLE